MATIVIQCLELFAESAALGHVDGTAHEEERRQGKSNATAPLTNA